MKKAHYIELVPTYIKGIPCLLGVTHYFEQKPFKGSAYLCDSSDDYYGYTDVEYDILDRKGYPASWLERKTDRSDKERFEQEIKKYMSSCDSDY